jgi:hypothetical protein
MSTRPWVVCRGDAESQPGESNDDSISDAFSYLSCWVVFLMKRSTRRWVAQTPRTLQACFFNASSCPKRVASRARGPTGASSPSSWMPADRLGIVLARCRRGSEGGWPSACDCIIAVMTERNPSVALNSSQAPARAPRAAAANPRSLAPGRRAFVSQCGRSDWVHGSLARSAAERWP